MKSIVPLSRATLLKEVVPSLVRAIETCHPMSETQIRTVASIRAIARNMNGAGLTNTGHVLRAVLYAGKTMPKKNSCTVALSRMKKAMNDLFVVAELGVVCHTDKENRKGNGRALYFEKSGAPLPENQANETACVKPLSKAIVIAAFAQVLRQKESERRPYKTTIGMAYKLISLLDTKGGVTEGSLLENLFADPDKPRSAQLARLRQTRLAMNLVFERANIPITCVCSTNRNAGDARLWYFVNTAPLNVTPITPSLVPRNSKHAEALLPQFLQHCRR